MPAIVVAMIKPRGSKGNHTNLALDMEKLKKERDSLLKRIYSSRRVEIPEFPNRDYCSHQKYSKISVA